MWGQGLRPRGHHPIADRLAASELDEMLAAEHRQSARIAAAMPLHADYIAEHCAAEPISTRKIA